MQTDILLKQVAAALTDLRTAMDKFEKHPNVHYADQLHECLNRSNKLVAAYAVLKEQKEVSPELDLHLKIMSVDAPKTEINQAPATHTTAPTPELPASHMVPDVQKVADIQKPAEPVIEPVFEPAKPVEKPLTVNTREPEQKPEVVRQTTSISTSPGRQELPKLSISINDKFRLINELFASNANEYHIAIEQLNAVASKEEADAYLKGLKTIYQWDDEHEMVKRLLAMNNKRFI